MDIAYLARRKKAGYTSYRLNRRIDALISSIRKYGMKDIGGILEIGVADGMVLSAISNCFKVKRLAGIDICPGALKYAPRGIRPLAGNCLKLPFKEGAFDIVIASCVLEHIRDIDGALFEISRALKKNGLLFIILPNRIFDLVNSTFMKTYHVKSYSAGGISGVLRKQGYSLVSSKYFMLCPFFKFPWELRLEEAFRRLSLGCLLFNHITVARKV